MVVGVAVLVGVAVAVLVRVAVPMSLGMGVPVGMVVVVMLTVGMPAHPADGTGGPLPTANAPTAPLGAPTVARSVRRDGVGV